MRIAVAGLMHESNTFSSHPTALDDFRVQRGDEVPAWWRSAHHEIGGFFAGLEAQGCEAVPLMMAGATPSGIVTAEAYEALCRELLARLAAAAPFDGVLLALHGAMVSEEFADADGEIIRRMREMLGGGFPFVVTHDLHANISDQAVKHATALVVYQTYPHIDQRPRGVQAAGILARTVRGEIQPVQRMARPEMLLNIVRQNTNVEPVKRIMDAARELERSPGVLAASVALGYQYADVYEIGPAAIVVSDGDEQTAGLEAQRLSDSLWNVRNQLTFDLPEAGEAVRQAMASDRSPVILVDMGDNIGGGSAGDSTFLLKELLHQHLEDWVVVLCDPEAVQRCAAAGIGVTVTLPVGGKQDDLHGEPVEISGRVKCLHDGRFIETEPRHGGARYHDQGFTAVLELDTSKPESASHVVLTTHRQVPFSLQQMRSLGIEPERCGIIVVKAAIAYRAAYEPIAGKIIEVDTPGLTTVNPQRFTFRHARKPLWGMSV